MRTLARSTRSRCALLLSGVLLLGAGPAFAYPHCPPTVLCFFGEDPEIFDDDEELDLMDSDAKDAEDAFLALLGATAGTETFEHFESGDQASLRLKFLDRNDPYTILYRGRLTEAGTNDYGYIGTSDHEDRGFAISGETMWKNRGDESLVRFTFQETPMRALGFYLSGYREGAELELELKLENGDKIEVEIRPKSDEEEGNLFYFGVITPENLPFIAARLEYYGDEEGDVMAVDDVTVSPVPEPSTGLLLALGLIGLGATRRAARP